MTRERCRSYLRYETVHVELVGAGKEVEGASHQRVVAHRALVFSLHQSVPETISIVRGDQEWKLAPLKQENAVARVQGKLAYPKIAFSGTKITKIWNTAYFSRTHRPTHPHVNEINLAT